MLVPKLLEKKRPERAVYGQFSKVQLTFSVERTAGLRCRLYRRHGGRGDGLNPPHDCTMHIFL